MNEYLDSLKIEITKELQRFNNSEVLKFTDHLKSWKDKNFVGITFSLPEQIKVKISTLIYIKLLKTRPLPFKRIWKCSNIIFFTLNSQASQEYVTYFYLTIEEELGNSINSVWFSYKLIKGLNIQNSPLVEKLENYLRAYLRKGCKKVIFKCSEKQIVKYLGLALELHSYINCQTECLILAPLAIQILDYKYSLHGEEKKISSLETQHSFYYIGLVLYYILKSLHDNQTIELIQTAVKAILKKIDNKIFKPEKIPYLSYLKPFPYIPKSEKKPILFDMTQMCVIKTYMKSTYQELNLTYSQANYQNSEILLAIYDFSNNSKKSGFKEEIAKIMNINKLLGEKHCFQKLLGFYDLMNSYYLIFEPFYFSLIEVLTHVKANGNRVPEELVKKIAKNLIFSFRRLEKKKFFHGNLKPHFIFCNDDWEIRVGCFPVGKSVDYDLLIPDKPLIQGHLGYSAPDVPNKYEYGFDYLNKKADVFSLGLILLQLVTLETIEGLNNNKEKVSKIIDNIPFQWLRNLLIRMLRFKASERSSFIDIYLDRASIFI